jgi:hypothetical protein
MSLLIVIWFAWFMFGLKKRGAEESPHSRQRKGKMRKSEKKSQCPQQPENRGRLWADAGVNDLRAAAHNH